MCNDLGDWALGYYESAFYKYTSDAAHSGAWSIYRNLGRLVESNAPDEVDQCRLLATSAHLLLHVARPTLEFYPNNSLAEDWDRLDSKWGEFWSSLRKWRADEAS